MASHAPRECETTTSASAQPVPIQRRTRQGSRRRPGREHEAREEDGRERLAELVAVAERRRDRDVGAVGEDRGELRDAAQRRPIASTGIAGSDERELRAAA